MKKLNLYPEMNREIVAILRISDDDPVHLYAAQLIEEQAEKLAAYEEAEEQGRLVRLPCCVDDDLYYPKNNEVKTARVIEIRWDKQFSICVMFGDDDDEGSCDLECAGCPFQNYYTNHEAGDGGCSCECGFAYISPNDIGKTVLLTRAAAEAALAAQNGSVDK